MQLLADAPFDYSVISIEKAASARQAAERIRGRMQLAAESIIEVGRELIEQKASLGHGNFLPWVHSEFGMSDQSARRLIHVADQFGANPTRVLNFTPTALYALAAPSTPEPVREEVLERAAKGEKVSAKEIEALKRKLAKTESAVAEKEGQRHAQELLANTMERRAGDQAKRAMFAEADKERLAQEVEALLEEISRLQEDGTIHVLPNSAPTKSPSLLLQIFDVATDDEVTELLRLRQDRLRHVQQDRAA